jgi:16S rRNA C967 or C1407 C5-methylase (RsmB/RsmF family)
MCEGERPSVPCPDPPPHLDGAGDPENVETRAGEALPSDYVARLRADFDGHPGLADRLLTATVLEAPRGLRINALRGTVEDTLSELADDDLAGDPVPWATWARVVDPVAARRLTETDAWREGRVVLQSLSSMLAVVALDPKPGERILDLCAAPGGKSALIAALAEGTLDLLANDRSRRRCLRMRALLDTLGVTARIRTGPGERLPARELGTFDRVLVDAPCSGEGRFRVDDPQSHATWSKKAVRRLASLQKSLLHTAIAAVRPGGVIVYSTCTLGREENEAVVARALQRFGDGPTGIELDAVSTSIPRGLPLLGNPDDLDEAAMRRLGPDPGGDHVAAATEGFFLARLRRRGGEPVA